MSRVKLTTLVVIAYTFSFELKVKKIKLIIFIPPLGTYLSPKILSRTRPQFDNSSVIIAGDWNVVQDYRVDTLNYTGENNPKSKLKIN